jgi:hypothetical protein
MSKLVSPRIVALVNKLRQAEHAGEYFSADDVAGFIRELRAINDGVKALEDDIAGVRSRPTQATRPATPPMPPRAQPVGTFFFVPAEGRA